MKQHVRRGIRDRTTSGHSQMLTSAICEHLNAISTCAANYNYECFTVLHRAKTIYIIFDRLSLCKLFTSS